jgi:hypothetical protein
MNFIVSYQPNGGASQAKGQQNKPPPPYDLNLLIRPATLLKTLPTIDLRSSFLKLAIPVYLYSHVLSKELVRSQCSFLFWQLLGLSWIDKQV